MRRTHLASRHLKPILYRAALMRLARRCDLDFARLLHAYEKCGDGSIREGSRIRLGDGKVYVVERGDLLEGVTLHTFRHTHVSALLMMGLDIETIAERLGHEDATITLAIYAHMMPGRDREAAKAMDRFTDRLAASRQ